MNADSQISDFCNIISSIVKNPDIASCLVKNSLFIDNEHFVYISDNNQVTIANKLSYDIDQISAYNQFYGKLTNIYVSDDLSSWLNKDAQISIIDSNVFSTRNKNDNPVLMLEIMNASCDFSELDINSMSFQAYNYCIENNIEFPQTISKINKYNFSSSEIKEFVVPSNVQKIYQRAFNNSSLEKIYFNNNLVSIKEHAFDNCANLKHLDLENTQISSFCNVCNNCQSLISVSFPQTLEEIDFSFVSSCVKLSKLSFSNPKEQIVLQLSANSDYLKNSGIDVEVV